MAAETSEQQQPKEEDNLILPPGFRFHPTDEEIITCYLSEKIADRSFTAVAMGEVDLNKCEPWDLPKKAKMGEKAWYFFSQKERRYPTGMRTNRATESGYWKATGKDKEIRKGKGSASVLVGMKKTLVFYKGRAPRGQKTNWVMHEFRREGSCSSCFSVPTSSTKDDWVVVMVFHKNDASKKTPLSTATECDSTVNNNQSCSFFPHSGSSSFGYLHQCSPFVGQYREGEQFSNSTASISRDTRLSNDWNADISSYDHQDGPSSSSGPLFDLENIWNY